MGVQNSACALAMPNRLRLLVIWHTIEDIDLEAREYGCCAA
jgi:hypothetical protein